MMIKTGRHISHRRAACAVMAAVLMSLCAAAGANEADEPISVETVTLEAENTPEHTETHESTPEPTQQPGQTAQPSDTPEQTLEPTQQPEATPEPEAEQTPEPDVTADTADEATVAPDASPEKTESPAEKPWSIEKSGAVRVNKTTLRATPADDADKLGTMSKGDEVRVISGVKSANGGTWYLVKAGNKRGYVPQKAIVLAGEDDGSGLVKIKTALARKLELTAGAYGEGGMAVPRLYQFDYRTKLCYYGGIPRSVSTSGCNVTCISMVVAHLTGNIDQTPETLFDWALDNGLYCGTGLGHYAMSRVAEQWGVTTEWLDNDADQIIAALSSGRPVIAHMGDGLFTREGHYIVLRGVTDDGQILVNDPNSRANSDKAFPLDTILDQVRYSDSSFMVCYLKNEHED